MARQKTKYKLVKRYMCGTDTRYYGLISDSGKEVKVSEEQMSYLVGGYQVVNIDGQLYKGKVLFRGIGCEIKSLPAIQISDDKKGGVVKPDTKPAPKTVTDTKPIPKPVAKRHTLSEELLSKIEKSLRINLDRNHNTYEEVSKMLLSKYSNFAYNLEHTINFKDLDVQPIYVHCIEDNIYYISTNIWCSNDREYMAISKSTFELISYEYPSIVKYMQLNIDKNTCKYCHYHELAIRILAFSRIPQYKKLKMHFMKYNNEIFEDKIPRELILMVGEYKSNTHFDDLEGCAGYSASRHQSSNNFPFILMRYGYFRSVNHIDNLSRTNTCTLLHEMGHAYVDAVYGSNWETDPYMYGSVLYGIDEKVHPVQHRSHGKKFGDTVRMISRKTGFSFDEIFSYGVHIDNTKRVTDYTRDFGADNVEWSDRSDTRFTETYHMENDNKYTNYGYRKSFVNIKNQLINNQDYFKNFFKNKFNIQLEFNINNDESRIITIDRFGIHREYDLNFYAGGKSAVLVYRVYENNTVMIDKEYIESTPPQGMIKRVLQSIYNDTITN